MTPDRSREGSTLYLAGVCRVASPGGVLFSFDTAVISGTVGIVEAQFGLSKLPVGWFWSSALAGCVLGAVLGGLIGDRFGREPILIHSDLLFFITAIFSAVPPRFAVLIPVRLIGGVGAGDGAFAYLRFMCRAERSSK